jgi:hypothetical protein
MLSVVGTRDIANAPPPLPEVESEYGVQLYTGTVRDLFELYERTGFLYQAKAARLIPHMDRVQDNWRRLLQAGDSLLYVLTAGDSRAGIASVAAWRTTLGGWNWQHLVCEGNPLASRSVMLGGLVRSMQIGREESQQNWFRPENRFPSRVFGSMMATVGESVSSAERHVYVAWPRPTKLSVDPRVRIVPYHQSYRDELCAIATASRGSVYVQAEELDGDVELQELDVLYRSVRLRRYRRVHLAYLPGRDEAAGAAIAYRGPLGLNFSFIENRCDLLLAPGLSDADITAVTGALLQAAASTYELFELSDIPIMADIAAAPALSALGGRFLRHYCHGIWLRAAQPALYGHVDRFYAPLVNRAKKRGIQQPTLSV